MGIVAAPGRECELQPSSCYEELNNAMPTKADLTGLTDQEVQRQRARGLGNDVKIKTGRTYGQIARDNLFTFFNIVLFSLAAVLLLLGSPRDAFFTGAIAFLNVVVATTQEVRAKRKLDQIALLTRPKATVVRAGHEQTVDPTEIVAGDLLVAGPGDQVLADGVVLGEGKADLDESLLTGESDLMPKTTGNTVLSGSFVVNGRLYYTAEKVGAESFANKLTASARRFTRELTPLQREVNLVVRLLLLLVLFFGALIGINYFLSQRADLLESVQAASVVFGLAPSSLFLMIVVAYALGAVRIADKGALVQQANAVESLSHVDMLCLDKTGTLTANAIQLDTVQPLGELDEGTLKQLLGDFAAQRHCLQPHQRSHSHCNARDSAHGDGGGALFIGAQVERPGHRRRRAPRALCARRAGDVARTPGAGP